MFIAFLEGAYGVDRLIAEERMLREVIEEEELLREEQRELIEDKLKGV
jgi:hypothetical protein